MKANLFLLPALLLSVASAEVVWHPGLDQPEQNWFEYSSPKATAKRISFSDKMVTKFRYSDTGTDQYAGSGYNWNLDGKVRSLTGYTGVCVTYRSANPVRLNLQQSTITDSDYFGKVLPAVDDFTPTFVPFDDLKQENWGVKKTWSTANHKGISFDFKVSVAKDGDSTNTFEVVEIGLGSDCSTAHNPKKGLTIQANSRFWDSAEETPETATNTFGGQFLTYSEGSSSVTPNKTAAAMNTYLKENSSVGFSSSGTAGLSMDWLSDAASANISAATGICIAYKSASGVRLTLLQEGLKDEGNYFGASLPAQNSYTIQTIPFKNFKQDLSAGYASVLDLQRTTGLRFEYSGSATSKGDIDILQIGFDSSCEMPKYPPVLADGYEELETKTLNEGDTLVFPLKKMFTDRDDEELKYIYSLTPETGIASMIERNDSLLIVAEPNKDGKVTLIIIASDGTSSVPYQCEITVVDSDNPPTAKDDFYTVNEDDTLKVSAKAGILSNDFDVDGNSFSLTAHTEPAHGSLTLSDDGSFTYIPEENFAGADYFTYTIEDDTGLSSTGGVYITIVEVNDLPTVSGTIKDQGPFEEDFGTKNVLIPRDSLTFSDIETPEDKLVYSVTSDKKIKASLAVNSVNFIITLTSVQDSNGTAKVTLWAKDEAGDSVGVSFNVIITPVPDAPVALDDEYTTPQDSVFKVTAKDGVLKNDYDIDGDTKLSAQLKQKPANGTVILNADGSFTYTPDEDFVGEDSFTYVVVNSSDLSSEEATVTITVTKRNKGPKTIAIAGSQDTTLNEDFKTKLQYAKSTLLSWFKDPDGDPLTISATNPDNRVRVEMTSGGYLNIFAQPDSTGEAVVIVSATDNIKGNAPATFEIHITLLPVNDPPRIINRDTIYVEATGFHVEIDLDSLFFDPEGDEITYTLVSSNVFDASILGSILSVSYNKLTPLSPGSYRVRVQASDGEASTELAIAFAPGGPSSFVKKDPILSSSYRSAIQNTRGKAKFYNMEGALLAEFTLPISEDTVKKVVRNAGGRALLRIQGSTWSISSH